MAIVPTESDLRAEDSAMTRSSVPECNCEPQYACGRNPQPIDDKAFWEELFSQLISIACLIERQKLGRTITTSDLRKAGKESLCNGKKT